MRVDTQAAVSFGSRPTSAPLEFVNLTIISSRPLPFVDGCVFCLSMFTTSPCLRTLAPLRVAQPPTPNPPRYLCSGIWSNLRGFAAASDNSNVRLLGVDGFFLAPSFNNLVNLLSVSSKEIEALVSFLAGDTDGSIVLHDPSKYIFTA